MPTPFAALEARLNTAVFAHLANATADFGGGVVVDGMFDTDPADAFGVVSGHQMRLTVPRTGLGTLARGATVTIGGTAYHIVSHDQGDGVASALVDPAAPVTILLERV